MNTAAALILAAAAIAVVYYLRRAALALEAMADISDEIDSPAAPAAQSRGLGGGGRLAK